jgi:phage protein D
MLGGGPLAAQFDLIINGSPVSAAVLGYVGDVVVDDSVDLPSMFVFSMMSSDAQEQNLPWIDDDLFSIGNSVEIKMGWGNALTRLIAGEITALEPEFVTSGIPSLKVRGYDRRHRLLRGRKTRTFLQKKDSDIATQIGGEAGLTVQSTDSGASLDYVLQANESDWEFLSGRARLIGYEVLLDDKTLFFQPTANDQGAVVKLVMSNDLLQFLPRLSVSGQATEVKVQGWNVKEKTTLLSDSKAGAEVSTMGGRSSGAAIAQGAFGDAIDVVSDQPVGAQPKADQIAKALFNTQMLGLITGEGSTQGSPAIRAGKVIEISGVGQRFGGRYYVTSAVHRMSPAGYVTEFTVRRNAS